MTVRPTDVLAQLTRAAAGRERVARLLLVAALAGGHVLLDDVPGSGKTTLSKAFGTTLGLTRRRVQGTSDLLPSDIVGVTVFQRDRGEFEFFPGPVFTQMLLCDELNRCPPRTQSALLEAMAEGQVTVDGHTRPLPEPFLVVATQNPTDGHSTLALPQAQWDRFLFCLTMGRLDPATEQALLVTPVHRHAAHAYPPLLDAEAFLGWARASQEVFVHAHMSQYLWGLLEASKDAFPARGGLSLRAGQDLMRAARAWAWLDGQATVTPEAIQAVFVPGAVHRLLAPHQLADPAEITSVEALLTRVPLPRA